MEWTTLPESFQQAAAGINGESWALVSNPNPADRLHLRETPDTKSASFGKYDSGTPVKALENQTDWVKVVVFGRTGWMMAKYLTFTPPHTATLSAMPLMQFTHDTVRLFELPDNGSAYRELNNAYGMFVIGILEDQWYQVWFPESGASGFIVQSELFPGNG